MIDIYMHKLDIFVGNLLYRSEVWWHVRHVYDAHVYYLLFASNYIHYNVWDEITYPFLNFNGATVEV